MTISPIGGLKYHPPANAILGVLRTGTKLHLIPEPTNPFDKNAIMVLVESAEIGDAHTDLLAELELDELARGYGYTAAQILAEPVWQLGYIPKELAAQLQPFKACEGKLTFGSEGDARVEF